MRNAWRRACLLGTVQGPLHESSLLKIVVSRAECQRRIAQFYRDEGNKRRRAAATAAASTAAASAAVTNAAVAAANAPAANAPARAGMHTNLAAGDAPGDGAPAPPPVPPAGIHVHGLGNPPNPPPLQDISEAAINAADPPAWVVIHGVHPGVFYYR